MKERLKLLEPVRNLAAAVAISFLPTSATYAESIQSDSFIENHIELQDTPQQSSEDSLLEQLDEMVETDYGKAIAYSLLFYSIASGMYRIRKGKELDTDRKFGENVIGAASLLALSCSLVAQTETDVDPYITATFLTSFSLASAAYSVESSLESDRSIYKRATSIAAASSFLFLNSVILANTIDKT